MGHRRIKRHLRSPWVFHNAQWADLEVLVMPRTLDGKVVDSNTGVVVKAPFHKFLLAQVVVNDGSRPNCDLQAVNLIITGDRNADWRTKGYEPYCIPRRRISEEEKNSAYRMAVAAIVEGRKLSQDQAEAEADRVLGWGPDSIHCRGCHLNILGVGARELVTQAKEYGWRESPPLGFVVFFCSACAPAGANNLPSIEELQRLIPEENWA